MKNNIVKIPIRELGYGFIEQKYLPPGKDEYYLRNLQNRSGIEYRQLTAYEIEILVRNRNSSDNWNQILVSNSFSPELVKNCKFYGLVRIGKLEPYFLEYSRLKSPVGLYNSTIISCDFGDNVVVDNVNYMSHMIIGSEAILLNINELMTTPHAKFGNGILKTDEPESIRIWLELCNENSGRQVLPFNGMLASDAWLWSKYRDNDALLEKFKEFTQKEFDPQRGYYGKVGDRTVIKNCAIIKDVWIGSDAYLKGANKLKNLSINSAPGAKTQIGEGCEMVNGVVGFGCRAFYGVKAVRFIMGSNSQLKYGARLINAYLGDNATISCCEVLNTLIFPAHEQHHNNSFLCASVIMGQSNMAAGATIGSNHNSRANDGEIIAKRGFWPGLCVSLKHNSRFASFTIIAKGDYPSELDVPLPFCLLSQDVSKDELMLIPAYWFKYNMYALARNAWKYIGRDNRPKKIQHLEFNYLAPDTINEMYYAINWLETETGKWAAKQLKTQFSDEKAIKQFGKDWLLNPNNAQTDISITGIENSQRNCLIKKPASAYKIYKEIMLYYCANQLIHWCKIKDIQDLKTFFEHLPSKPVHENWLNLGGQFVPEKDVKKAINHITSGKINSWEALHNWYKAEGKIYDIKKAEHALATLALLYEKPIQKFESAEWINLLKNGLRTRKWLLDNTFESRKKDYTNPFRKMMYDSDAEMEKVLGNLQDNEFLKHETKECEAFEQQVQSCIELFK